MSGSNIGEGLETILVGASAFDADNVSRDDYGILETSSGCALIVLPGGADIEALTYSLWQATWHIEIEGYIMDRGTPQETLPQVWTLMDEVVAAVKADQSLNSSACSAVVSNVERPQDVFTEVAGRVWLPVFFTVDALEVF